MAIWELIVEAMQREHLAGSEWLASGEIVRAVQSVWPETNGGSVRADTNFHCINDPSKKHSPGLRYLRNPLLITDEPTMRGKRYRLLTADERAAFLAHPRDDLEHFSYVQVAEWLRDPQFPLVTVDDDVPESMGEGAAGDELGGPALLEMHLQDYLFRNWKAHFPDLELFEGSRGKEFATRDPSVGIIDFLAIDRTGNFVVIETKRNLPDRQAIGQVLGYMGWVTAKLAAGRTVRGVLISGSASDSLRMAVSAVPNLDVLLYELSFVLSDPTASSSWAHRIAA